MGKRDDSGGWDSVLARLVRTGGRPERGTKAGTDGDDGREGDDPRGGGNRGWRSGADGRGGWLEAPDRGERSGTAKRDTRLRTMGRRRLLSALVAAGFGSMAALLTADDVVGAGRDEVPIVYGFARGEDGTEPRKTTVPADWFDDLRAATAAHAEFDPPSRSNVATAAVVPGDFGGRNAAVEVDVPDGAAGSVPERIGEVPVEVNRIRATEPVERDAASRADDDPFDRSVPGGIACAGTDSRATLAPAMYAGSTPFFATANHVYGADGDSYRGRPVFLPDAPGEPRIGSIRRGYALDDFLRIDPEEGFDPASEIRGASPSAVVGQFSRAGLAELKARGEPLEMIGARTGHTAGPIRAIDGMTCAYGKVCKHGQLKWGSASDFGDGDSGSVNYHPDPENPDDGIMIGGFNNARTWWPIEDYIWGTAAHHVTSQHGFAFHPVA